MAKAITGLTLSALVLIAALACAVFTLTGCDYETVTPKNYASTNAPPSRFKVVSSDYYHMGENTPDFTLTVLSDTQGTNDFVVVNSMHGLAIMYTPKPVKQLEDNGK
jgi:hypothetical protein